MSKFSIRRISKAKVILFDDIKGEGILKTEDGKRIKVSYRDVPHESMFFLIEGEEVIIELRENRVVRIDRIQGD